MAAPNGLIVAWPSTAASIPSGWSRYAALDDRLPRSAASSIGTTGGATTHTHLAGGHNHSDTHTHVASAVSGNGSGSIAHGSGGGVASPNVTHNHTYTLGAPTTGLSVSTSGTTNFDSQSNFTFGRYTVIWIQSNGTTDIPVNAVAWTAQTTIPTGWASHASSLNYYFSGAAAGANGGATIAGALNHTHSATAAHDHTHSAVSHQHNPTVSTNPGTTAFPSGTAVTGASVDHVHAPTIPSATHAADTMGAATATTQTPGNQYPASMYLKPVQATSAVVAPFGIIALWTTTTAPTGWTACNGTNSTPNLTSSNNFIYNSSTTPGQQFGSPNHDHFGVAHDHTNVALGTHGSVTLPAPTGTMQFPSGGTSTSSTTHTHTGVASGVRDSAGKSGTTSVGTTSDNFEPPYVQMFFIMALAPAIPATSKLTLPTPEMKTTGLQRDIGASKLTLPSPVMKGTGQHYSAATAPTTAIIDDFSGGNDTDINARVAVPSNRIWTAPMPGHSDFSASPTPIGITSGKGVGTGAGWSSGILSGTNSRAVNPIEVYFTQGGGQINLCWCITTPGVGTTKGYLAACGSAFTNLYRIDNGVLNFFATIYINLFTGDKIAIRHDPGGTIHVLLNRGTGWFEAGTGSDNTYSSGQIAVFPVGAASLDDLGGTEVPAAVVRLTLPFPEMKATGLHTVISAPSGTAKLELPSPEMKTAGIQRLTAASKLTLPSPVVVSTALQRLPAQSKLTLPTPEIKSTGLVKDIAVSKLTLPTPLMKSQGLQRDTSTSRLTLPFPELRAIATAQIIWDHPYNTTAYGTYPYDSWPLSIPDLVSANAKLELPFPILSALGIQRTLDTGIKLTAPFPELKTVARQTFKTGIALTLPSPIVKATGLQRDIATGIKLTLPTPVLKALGIQRDLSTGIRLTLPSPIIVSTGRQRDFGLSKLTLPTPLLKAQGGLQGPPTGLGVLTLPFPVIKSAGLQRLTSQSRLTAPFPVLVTIGRQTFKSTARLTLPSPVLLATGFQRLPSQSIILTLPSPILKGLGNVPTQGRTTLVLPFPILIAAGQIVSPISVLYESTVSIPEYLSVLYIPNYESTTPILSPRGVAHIPQSPLITPIPEYEEVHGS